MISALGNSGKYANQLLEEQQCTSQHLMKRSFILKTDWLTYSHGISQNSFEESNNRCVYSQLEDILLRPKIRFVFCRYYESYRTSF